MEWSKKVKMCEHLNRGEWEEAVNVLLANKDDLDAQAVDMFITGFDLTQYELCRPIADIIEATVENIGKDKYPYSLRSQIRLHMLHGILNGEIHLNGQR